jgi:hypothetical protein
MQTLRITASQEIIQQVIHLVETLPVQRFEIEPTIDPEEKTYLRSQLDDIDSGKAVFFTLNEAEEVVEKTLRKYENPDHG